MNKHLTSFLLILKKPQFLLLLYLGLVLTASLQSWVLTESAGSGGKTTITRYNNYVIFKNSHFHLLEGKPLFSAYPDEHWDLYKYSPTFALFFGVFSWFPDWLGLTLWNLLNVVVFFLAIRLLPLPDEKAKMLFLLFSIPDVLTSLQNSQSNVLVAGLLILGLGLLEREQFFLATGCIVATFFIKIFGVVALTMLLFYPQKPRNILYVAFWMVFLGVLPVMVTGIDQLLMQYTLYLELLKNDQSVSLGISVMGWLNSWFGINFSKTLLALGGLMLIGTTLMKGSNFRQRENRYLFFAAMLVWMVIFNHKAESPTFIIATSGVFLWFLTRWRSGFSVITLVAVLVFTSLSSSDLFPPFIRNNIFEPYVIKVVPCIFAWILMLTDLWRSRPPAEVGDSV